MNNRCQIYFPLDQPHSTRDWDVVVFGDGTCQGQLLYAFRMDGLLALESVFKEEFAHAEVQYCWVHISCNVLVKV